MLIAVLAVLASAAEIATDDPAAVTRAWLEAGSTRGVEDARAWVLARCHDAPVGRAAPVHFLGAPLTLSELTVTTESVQGAVASVRYALVGSVAGQDATSEARVLGQAIQLEVKGLTVDRIESEGTVTLERTKVGWRVSCPQDPAPAPSAAP